MDDERLDTKGRRIGQRSSPDKGKFPKRVETGLCPGLEAGLRDVVEKVAGLQESVRAMSYGGLVGSEGVVAMLATIERLGRDALAEWAPRRGSNGTS